MKKLIGDKHFYKMVLLVAVPIMIQNGITNFVGLLDNVMVGQVGTEQMSGVAIVNQLIFVYSLCIFGGLSGAGIFGAQFYGQDNQAGIRDILRLKIWIGILITFLGFLVLGFLGEPLINAFLAGESNKENVAVALYYGKEYLWIMMAGIIPFCIVQIYSSTLRETGETIVPMAAGIVAVLINLIFNYILIFGKFGAPAMGVAGAAIATVLSRFVECAIVVIWTHTHKERNIYIMGLYRSLKVPLWLTKKVIIKGMPLLMNEALWAAGMAMLLQCYSVRGLNVVAGMNISNTIANLFNIVFIAMGNSVAIIVGQLLGAGKMKEARDTDTKMIAFSVASCIVIGAIMVAIAPLFPKMYNTTDEVRGLAESFIIIAAVFMPQNAFLHAAYFTLRSGGKTVITFFFDSVFAWVVSIPLAYVLSRYTGLSIVLVYFCCQGIEIIKCIIGFILVKKGSWLQNIISQ